MRNAGAGDPVEYLHEIINNNQYSSIQGNTSRVRHIIMKPSETYLGRSHKNHKSKTVAPF
jgi:hypothetical protein